MLLAAVADRFATCTMAKILIVVADFAAWCERHDSSKSHLRPSILE